MKTNRKRTREKVDGNLVFRVSLHGVNDGFSYEFTNNFIISTFEIENFLNL